MAASGPRPTAPGSGNEFRPWKEHPVAVTATPQARTTARRTNTDLLMTRAQLLQAAMAHQVLRAVRAPDPAVGREAAPCH